MSIQYTVYNKDNPRGVRMDAEDEYSAYQKKLRLADDGWVDAPEKLGINLYGPDQELAVQTIRLEYEAGKLPAMEKPDGYDDHLHEADRKELQRKAEEAAAFQKKVRADETLAQMAREARERQKDLESDAAKAGKGDLKPPPELPANQTPQIGSYDTPDVRVDGQNIGKIKSGKGKKGGKASAGVSANASANASGGGSSASDDPSQWS